MAGRPFIRWAVGLATIAASCAPLSARAEIILLRAEGNAAPAFKPGMRLAEGQTIDLGDGEALWLVDNFGTRKLQGPGRWRLLHADHGDERSRFEDLMKLATAAARNERREITAATRSPAPNDGDRLEAPILQSMDLDELLRIVDVGADGNYCIWGDQIRLVGGPNAASATLTGATGKKTITFDGRFSNTVSADFLLVRAGDVTIQHGGQVHHARFTRIAAPRNLEELATSVATAGCASSISALIEKYPAIGKSAVAGRQ